MHHARRCFLDVLLSLTLSLISPATVLHYLPPKTWMLSVLTELHHDLGSTAQAHCARPISESGKPGQLIEIVEVFDSRP
jgi:hypothetical protein